jgi:hypothetical protein
MKLSQFLVFFAGSFALAHAPSAQNLLAAPEPEEAPVLIYNQPPEVLPDSLFLQAKPAPPPPIDSPVRDDAVGPRVLEDRYRTEIKVFAQNRHQFVHCKLKNGKILTGKVRSPGYEAFTLHTEAIGEGTYIYYKDLAESPRPVAAVGTRFKHGAEWTGLVALMAAAVPLLIVFSPFIYASGWKC